MPNRSLKPISNLVAVLAYDGVCTFELGIAVEVFGLPGMGPDWYQVVVCADRPGQPLSANGGVKIVAHSGLEALSGAGTIILPGWQNIDAIPPEILLEALRCAHANGARIASICSGVFVLAAAGLLTGRRAAVHWANAGALGPRCTDNHRALRLPSRGLRAGCTAGPLLPLLGRLQLPCLAIAVNAWDLAQLADSIGEHGHRLCRDPGGNRVLLSMIQGQGPPLSPTPGLDRFAGIMVGLSVLLVITMVVSLFRFAPPTASPASGD